MLSAECLQEIDRAWLPNMTDPALDRVIDLLEKGSPLLVHGCFSKALPMGCLASQIAWHHPRTEHLTAEAGISWLYGIAGLNPATSHVLRAWDLGGGITSWEVRTDLLACFLQERDRRSAATAGPIREREVSLVN